MDRLSWKEFEERIDKVFDSIQELIKNTNVPKEREQRVCTL